MAGYEVHLTDDRTAYADAVLPFLRRRPAENRTLIRIATRTPLVAWQEDPPLWLWVSDGGGNVVLAAHHTPPFGPWFSPGPARAVHELAAALVTTGRRVNGCGGDMNTATTFAADWAGLTGARTELHVRLGLMTCKQLSQVPTPPGEARLARADEAPLLREWFDAFIAELDLHEGPGDPVGDAIAQGEAHVWEVDSELSCFVIAAAIDDDVSSVGPVYTPPEHRQHGYAAACTAAATKTQLDAGRICTLYTDAANPTSNAIYARIGYVRAGDAVEYRFTDAS